MRAALRCALAVLMVGVACDRGQQAYYRTMHIDPSSLHVSFAGSVSLYAKHTGDLYFRFDDARGRPGITHLMDDDSGHLVECFDFLGLDTAYTLVYRSKSRELRRGEFGLILAQSTFYYAPEYGERASMFIATPNPNAACAEHPTVLAAAPDTATLSLDAISLVLIGSAPNGYTISSGNYAVDGRLQSYTRGTVHPRAGVAADSQRAENVGTVFVEQPPSQDSSIGLPATLPIPASAMTVSGNVLSLVSLHYNHGRLVQQMADSLGTRLPVRWLSFAPTHADSVLETIDRTRTFGLTTRRK